MVLISQNDVRGVGAYFFAFMIQYYIMLKALLSKVLPISHRIPKVGSLLGGKTATLGRAVEFNLNKNTLLNFNNGES